MKKHATLLIIVCISLPWAVKAAAADDMFKEQDTARRIRQGNKLRQLTLPERNEAEQSALAQAAQIQQMIDQTEENPGIILMRHSDWIPLPAVLLSLIKDYSRADVTFKRLSELTNGQTWLPSVRIERNTTYLARCRSMVAAYRKEARIIPGGYIFLDPDLCRIQKFGRAAEHLLTPETTFDTLKKEIAQWSTIPEKNLELCIQIHTNVIIRCSGLESFLIIDPNFKYLIRAYNNNIEMDLDDEDF